VIQSFGDKRTEDLYNGIATKLTRQLRSEVLKIAPRKLDMLNAAHVVADLRSPPGNRLEALKGDLAGFYCIRINSQWRIIFTWTSAQAGPGLVRIVDYH
jgi:proteic killer suppression protein